MCSQVPPFLGTNPKQSLFPGKRPWRFLGQDRFLAGVNLLLSVLVFCNLGTLHHSFLRMAKVLHPMIIVWPVLCSRDSIQTFCCRVITCRFDTCRLFEVRCCTGQVYLFVYFRDSSVARFLDWCRQLSLCSLVPNSWDYRREAILLPRGDLCGFHPICDVRLWNDSVSCSIPAAQCVLSMVSSASAQSSRLNLGNIGGNIQNETMTYIVLIYHRAFGY